MDIPFSRRFGFEFPDPNTMRFQFQIGGTCRILPSRGIALHAAGIGRGAAAAARARGGGQTALRPIGADLDGVTSAGELVADSARYAVFDHEHSGPGRSRPERDREMLGVPRWRIDRFLQIEPGMDMAQEKLRDPLVLLVAAGRAPGKIWLTIAQRDCR